MALVTLGANAPQSYNQAMMTIGFALDYTLASGTYALCTVPKGWIVHEVCTVITTVMDGTPTITIGDGDDVDGYLTSANVAPGTAESVTTPALKSSRGIANPYQYGKRYNAEDTVDAVWTAGTTPTTGVLKGYIVLVPLPDLGPSNVATTA